MMSTAATSRRYPLHAIAAATGLALLVAGCSSAIDAIPTALGGLPEGVPQRPAAPPAYPAVHDMPPRRGDVALSDAESKRLRQELTVTRDRVDKEGEEIKATGTTATTGSTPKP